MSDYTAELGDVYGAQSPAEIQKIYDQWSSRYDADNISRGFRLPALGAGLLAQHLGRTNGPILDAGCGTGLVAETLNLMGYGPITGCDISAEMIAEARKTGAYANFAQADMGAALPFEDDSFAGFVCVGSFGPGHAPPSTLEHLARVTRPDGYGVFNVIEATYQDQGFPQVIDRLTDTGQWEIIYQSPRFLPFLLGEPELWSHAYVVKIL
ncbi:class I SAM-dependent methyltransferase [Roseovarius sp. EL26]|uniref:class I SAM-dependent DNA methyltransferase n=1 Tax=Roseovarius sp. EL26 TaxID=2126672 RepID=UPI000EA25B44|nr:class I SAM-dependent methyltransferase [Roseovarius sp. EL26]